MWLTRADYTAKRVGFLMSEYASLQYRKDRLNVLVELADLERCLKLLPRNDRTLLVAHGMIGIPIRDVAAHLYLASSTAYDRYLSALEHLLALMNGEEH